MEMAEALAYVRKYVARIVKEWDAGRDAKVGKMLLALNGDLPSYDAKLNSALDSIFNGHAAMNLHLLVQAAWAAVPEEHRDAVLQQVNALLDPFSTANNRDEVGVYLIALNLAAMMSDSKATEAIENLESTDKQENSL